MPYQAKVIKLLDIVRRMIVVMMGKYINWTLVFIYDNIHAI